MKNSKEVLKSPLFIIVCIICVILAALCIFLVVCDRENNSEIPADDSFALNEGAGGIVSDTDINEENPSAGGSTVSGSTPSGGEAVSKPSKYVSKSKVKETIMGDSLVDPGKMNFITITLDESQSPAIYDVVCETADGYTKFIYKINALNGLCRYRTYYNADNYIDEGQIGLFHDGDGGGAWNKYWEENFSPEGQSFYDDIPIPSDSNM